MATRGRTFNARECLPRSGKETLETKIEIIHELQKGSSQRVVAGIFGVAKSTVSDIWRDRKKIKDCVSMSESLVFAIALFVCQNLSWLIQLVGNGFVNNAQREHL